MTFENSGIVITGDIFKTKHLQEVSLTSVELAVAARMKHVHAGNQAKRPSTAKARPWTCCGNIYWMATFLNFPIYVKNCPHSCTQQCFKIKFKLFCIRFGMQRIIVKRETNRVVSLATKMFPATWVLHCAHGNKYSRHIFIDSGIERKVYSSLILSLILATHHAAHTKTTFHLR